MGRRGHVNGEVQVDETIATLFIDQGEGQIHTEMFSSRSTCIVHLSSISDGVTSGEFNSISERCYVMNGETVQGILSVGSQVVVGIRTFVVDHHVINDS